MKYSGELPKTAKKVSSGIHQHTGTCVHACMHMYSHLCVKERREGISMITALLCYEGKNDEVLADLFK